MGAIIGENRHATSQATLRITVVLLVGLLLITQRFGVEAALGAFFAGMVLRQVRTGPSSELDEKLDAVGYGFFIPVFFVVSGMALDVDVDRATTRCACWSSSCCCSWSAACRRCWCTAARSPLRERFEMMLLTATALPLLVALSEIGLSSGVMLPENAAALVGAGVLSVAIFPLIAVRLRRRAEATQAGEIPATS